MFPKKALPKKRKHKSYLQVKVIIKYIDMSKKKLKKLLETDNLKF